MGGGGVTDLPIAQMKQMRISEENSVQKAAGAADQSQAKRDGVDQSMRDGLEESGLRGVLLSSGHRPQLVWNG